jgi:acetate kinase
MAFTLIINPGSSSKKYTLVDAGRTVATYRFERNEQQYEVCREHNGQGQLCAGITGLEYTSALAYVLSTAVAEQLLPHAEAITRVGLRVVAPGTYFTTHRRVDTEYRQRLDAARVLAPLHIPHTLAELDEILRLLPAAVVVGASDSAFHSTVPAYARALAIEAKDVSVHDLHRFGYHGLSYASIARQLPTLLPPTASRVVVCHIGSGMSMCALKAGISIDTTMGFAPGSGLMMGARTGDIEPAVVLELMRIHHMKPLDMHTYLQTRGGFVGLTGESDFRHLLARLDQGDEAVTAAFQQCVYRFQKTLGSYLVALGGLDAVVLTATAAERSPQLRALLLGGLATIGIDLDEDRNDMTMGRDGIISTSTSAVTVAVIRTNESAELLAVTESL